MATELFATWHKDFTITNGKTAANWHTWSYHRTCYGKTLIASDTNCVANWKIKIDGINLGTGYVCIGIDSIHQTETWFYENKQSPNYAYECTGDVYKLGEIKAKQQTYTEGNTIQMELNTVLGLLTFYNSDTFKNLKIKTGPEIVYRLAISIKDATVTILDFNMKLEDTLNNDDIKEDVMQSAQIQTEFEQLQNNYINMLQEMEDSKAANVRQQTTILALNKQIEETETMRKAQILSLRETNITIDNEFNEWKRNYNKEIEEKQQYDMMDMSECIMREMTKFKQIYNEKALIKICKKNPTDFVNGNSLLNRDIKSYENSIGNMMKALNSFTQYIKNTKVMMNNISSPNKAEYKYWNIDSMLIWIGSIENGRFIKYLDVLRNGFVKSEITKGEYLPDLDVATLSVQPFNINSFPDKKDLVKRFKQLESNEGVETIYH